MTKISCGYYCKHNNESTCSSKVILIDEDRTCSNFEYDSTKAECGFCVNYCEGYCSEDDYLTEPENKCRNGKFSAV